MKKLFIVVCIFLFYAHGFAGLSYKQLVHIPWGDGPTQAHLRIAPGGQYGPAAFRVQDNDIYILDSGKRRLLHYDPAAGFSSIPIQLSHCEDFVFRTPDEIVLLAGNELFALENKTFRRIYTSDNPRVLISSLEINAGQVQAHLSNQNLIRPFAANSTVQHQQNLLQVSKSSFYSATIQDNFNISINIDAPKGNLGAIRHLGSGPDGIMYVYVEFIREHVPLAVDRYVHLYTKSGTLLSRIVLPIMQHSYIFREFEVDADGNLYHMISSPDGIYVVAWNNNGRDNYLNEYQYPAQFSTDHHYNYLVSDAPEHPKFPKQKDTDLIQASITRNEALAIGDTYVQHVWTAEAKNLTNGRISDPAGNDIETPPWIVIGQNSKVPYKWGGFWTLAGFDQGLIDGKYAGDIATSHISSYCVGVDCSGFVSRCWKLASHYSTRMMDDNITIAYDSWDKIQPADAIHKEGHVRLFVDFNNDGSLLAVEASGRDWRVAYHSYTYSQLTAYAPRYYINMEGAPTLIARPVMKQIVTNDSVEISWTLTGQGDIGGFNLYQTYDGVNWEYAAGDNTIHIETRQHNMHRESELACYFKLTATASDDPETEGYPSDTYGYRYVSGAPKVLIVDGFDRTSGSYRAPYHPFAMHLGKSLANYQVSFETIGNDYVGALGAVLNTYDAIFWLLGDESTENQTFSSAEQEIVKNYLRQGGKLFVSGSEIAWDLDYKGSAADRDFIHNYLCAAYYQDDSQSYTVTGSSGAFDGLTIQYDDGTHGIYPEDFPDAFNPSNSSQAILEYANGKIAGLAKTGLFSGGSSEGSVIIIGFPFETIYESSQQRALAGAILNYFGLIETTIAANRNDIFTKFELYGNYPNPFNPVTHFHFNIPTPGSVDISIYDVLGRTVAKISRENLTAGTHKISYDASRLSSGSYLYIIRWRDQRLTGKMLLVK